MAMDEADTRPPEDGGKDDRFELQKQNPGIDGEPTHEDNLAAGVWPEQDSARATRNEYNFQHPDGIIRTRIEWFPRVLLEAGLQVDLGHEYAGVVQTEAGIIVVTTWWFAMRDPDMEGVQKVLDDFKVMVQEGKRSPGLQEVREAIGPVAGEVVSPPSGDVSGKVRSDHGKVCKVPGCDHDPDSNCSNPGLWGEQGTADEAYYKWRDAELAELPDNSSEAGNAGEAGNAS